MRKCNGGAGAGAITKLTIWRRERLATSLPLYPLPVLLTPIRLPHPLGPFPPTLLCSDLRFPEIVSVLP